MINSLTMWAKFMVNDPINIKKHDQHAPEIQANLPDFHQAWK
jgi:hypothetical protein